jgi:pimeloyl-ACP methyl ester carboxylesterase
MRRLVVGLLLAPLLIAAPAHAAATTHCHMTLPTADENIMLRPVVLVHGWNSSASAMEGLAKAIDDSSAKPAYYLFCFDYSDRATHWPQGKETHQKLADAIVRLSEAFRRGGGDGRVLAAGHSMGGIAIRYASRDTSHGMAVANVLAGVVTFGTPHIGSPWGGTKLASEFERSAGKDQRALPPDVSDAALCLAPLTRRAASCGDVPYLPAGVPLTELGAQITVHRTLFDIGIAKETADIPLFGDGIVPQESSGGYLFSGPSIKGSRRLPYGVALDSDTVACAYSTDYLKSLAAGGVVGGVRAGPIGAVVGGLDGVLTNERLDSAAEDALLQGKASLAMIELTAYAYRTPCFHTNLTTDPQLVKDAVAAFERDAAATTPATSLSVSEVKVPDLGVRRYDTTGTYPQVSGGGLDLSVVNAALKGAVLSDESAYRKAAQSFVDGDTGPQEYRGVYDMSSDSSEVLANTGLVSTMYPSLELYPGGNDGGGWITTTVRVPSGTKVALADLFPAGSDYLAVVAAKVRALVNKTYYCIPPGGEPVEQQAFDEGLSPTEENYAKWALTPDGLDIGLGQAQIGIEACGTHRFEIPWSALQSALSPAGKKLAKLAGQGLSSVRGAPCTGTRIYAGAAAKEHLRAADYHDQVGEGPFADYVSCHDGWAIAVISRPVVGTTDGETLFRTSGTQWLEVADVGGDELRYCDLVRDGMPLSVAKKFTTDGGSAANNNLC